MTNKFEGENISLLAVPLRRFKDGDPALRINRLALKLQKTRVSFDANSVISTTHRNADGTSDLTIGALPYSDELVRHWNMEASTPDEQRFVKLAHELAHAYQLEKGYERALVDFLNGSNNVPEDTLPYIELYALLSGTGPINPLSIEPVYKKQSESSGSLKMEILEDITELISAYIISDEYFLYRLENSMTDLSHDQMNVISQKVIQVCRDLH